MNYSESNRQHTTCFWSGKHHHCIGNTMHMFVVKYMENFTTALCL